MCSKNNKENSRVALKNGTITSIFKVKKCLFDPTFSKVTDFPPKAGSPMLISSPITNDADIPFDDSPYSLFKIRKRRSCAKNCSPVDKASEVNPIVTTPTPKRTADDGVSEQKRNKCCSALTQSPSVVKLAVQKSILNPNLIGDFSMPCTLSTIKGRHPDLKCISPGTVAGILTGCQTFCYTLIDCRYPYEYQGGHIKNALNIFNKDEIEKELFPTTKEVEKAAKQNVLIFYCEFSSERGPSMLRFLRSKDREMNKDCYPFLYYPEMYLLEGGYKAFFNNYKELCDPQEYKMMLDRECADDLAYYRAKCKSWSRRTKRLKKTRSSLVF